MSMSVFNDRIFANNFMWKIFIKINVCILLKTDRYYQNMRYLCMPFIPFYYEFMIFMFLAGSTITRAPRGTDRSPEYNEHFCYKLDSRVKILITEWNQKQQHFIKHASWSLLCIRFLTVAYRFEEEVFLRRKHPWPILPYPGSAPRQIWPNIFMNVPGHFIPTKFRKHPLSGSIVKADYVFPYIYMH